MSRGPASVLKRVYGGLWHGGDGSGWAWMPSFSFSIITGFFKTSTEIPHVAPLTVGVNISSSINPTKLIVYQRKRNDISIFKLLAIVIMFLI